MSAKLSVFHITPQSVIVMPAAGSLFLFISKTIEPIIRRAHYYCIIFDPFITAIIIIPLLRFSMIIR